MTNTYTENLAYFVDNPCYLENKKLAHSHKFGECEVDGRPYNGYVTSNGYYYLVEKKEVA